MSDAHISILSVGVAVRVVRLGVLVSRHMRPKNALDMQDVVVADVLLMLRVCCLECDDLVACLDLSKHINPKKPSDVQVVVEAVLEAIDVLTRVLDGGSSPSKQSPNHPGYLHDVVVGREVVVNVAVGTGRAMCDVVFSSSPSLHPNQPGVLQVDVDDVVVVDVFFVAVVVGSSRQPHQPGVLQVSVLVLVLGLVVEVGLLDLVVLLSVPFDSKYFQV